MSLRPRYSILTLLVLTALVAGGVKLWYGPHRVFSLDDQFIRYDYSYTRDWHGNKIQQGQMKAWTYSQLHGKLATARVTYYEQGKACWSHKISADFCMSYHGECAKAKNTFSNSPLNFEELTEYRQAVELFLEEFREQGCKHVYIEHDGVMTTLDF